MTYCYSCMSQIDTTASVCPYCKSGLPYIPVHPEDLPPGSRLNDGRFIVGRALGHGGYGITYIAFDTKMLVRRTIKEYYPRGAVRDQNLVPRYPESEEANVDRTRKHFLHEARMMIRASEGHIPGIVQGIDTFSENGTSYILMEYLEGCTLDDHMQKVGPFPWKTAVHYVAEALEALQKLHEKNILHRDISCNNIFLCADNSVRLIDFGSAELLDQAGTDPGSLWKSRKPAYTAREQAENRPQGAYTDLYAMGVVLYKMITGRVDRQLNGKTLPSVRAAVKNDPTIPAALDAVLTTATAEEPEKRFQSADEFRRKLLPLIGEKSGGKGGNRAKLIAALAALLAVLAVVIVLLTGGEKEDTWAVVELDSAQEDVTVPYGESFVLSGTAQPNEGVKLVLVQDGTEGQIIADETNADANGHWELRYDTKLANVDLNGTAGYVSYVAYQEESHKNRTGEMRLTVDRTLTPLTIGFAGQNSTVLETTLGEVITVTGSGQAGQPVSVVADDGTEWPAEWRQDGTWVCEIHTEDLKPAADTLIRDAELRAGYTNLRQRNLTGTSLKLTVRKVLAPITIAFAGDETRTTVLDVDEVVSVFGTAEPNESITVLTGSRDTRRVTVRPDGTWETELPRVNQLTEYQFNTRVEIPVCAYYNADRDQVSNEAVLVSSVSSDEYPVIVYAQGRVYEGQEIVLEGTAEAGARLDVEVQKEGTPIELAEPRTVICGEEGRWTLTILTTEIPDDRQEGVWTSYSVSVTQRKGQKTLTSNPVEVSVFRTRSLEIPTLSFTGLAGTEATIRYTDLTELSGTASAGEHLILLINDEPMQVDVPVGTDGRWNYTYSVPNEWIPATNEEKALRLRAKYVSSAETSEELILNVTNRRFAALALTLNDGQMEATTGGEAQVTLTVSGEAGERVTLYRNGSSWQTLVPDEKGTAALSMVGSEMTGGAAEAVFYATYAQQAETRSGEAILRLDRTAEPIRVEQEVNEESREIRGTGEPGAAISLQIEEREPVSRTVGEDGVFIFTDLLLNAGERVVLTETDAFGNTATWNARVAETQRTDIALDGYANGDYLTYGPSNNQLTLNGTGAVNRPILIRCTDRATGEQADAHVTAGENGQWTTEIALKLQDQAQTDLSIQYEDGKGVSIMLHAVCDNAIDPLVFADETIYETTPSSLVCTVGEANCAIRWALKDADGNVKQEGTLSVEGLRAEIPLPEGRIAGDVLEVTVSDALGNEAVSRLAVEQMRNEMTGKISSVLCGERDIYNGDTFEGGLQIQAYVVAGMEAAGTPALQLIQDGNVMGRLNLTQVTGEDLQRVSSRFPENQADLGWWIKGGNLASDLIRNGECELRLVMGSTVLETWNLNYGAAVSDQPVMHYEDAAIGYDVGLDAPVSAFRPTAAYLTGWYYDLYGEQPLSIKSGQLNLYEDQQCTTWVRSANAGNIVWKGRQPSTTQCGPEARELGSGTSKAGWIMTFQDKEIRDGTYWGKLDVGNLVFGPFQITFDSNAAQIRQKEFEKSLNWGMEE